MGQWAMPLGGGELKLFGQSYGARFESAGVIPSGATLSTCASDATSQFFCTYDPQQGGEVSRHGLTLRWTRASGGTTWEHQTYLTRRTLRVRENWAGEVNEKRYGAITGGLRGQVRQRAFEAGYDLRHDRADSTALDPTQGSGPAAFDLGFATTSLGLWGTGRWRPMDAFVVRAGLRA